MCGREGVRGKGLRVENQRIPQAWDFQDFRVLGLKYVEIIIAD
jgi:hypothetical protein